MIKPKDEIELAEAIAATNGPLWITGGGTRPLGNPVDGTVLDMTGLTGVHLYEPGALTLVVGAGTPLAEIDALLAGENQRLAFEPMDHRGLLGTKGASTIGGVVAANISGPRRIQSGACRDFLLGVRFVDGTGTILKNGGRVMKNVTGYDLVKLMAGSFGTLGAISEVSLKVLPVAETQAVVLLEGLEDQTAIAALSSALGSPFDVTGAAHFAAGLTIIRLEGFNDSVSYRAKALCAALSGFGACQIETDQSQASQLWQEVRDLKAFHDVPGDVWRISVKPSDGPEIGGRLRSLGGQVIYDWGGGLVRALLPKGTDARAQMTGLKGHARIERAPDSVKQQFGVFGSEGPVIDQIAAGLRAKFDPRGILNSGLMG